MAICELAARTHLIHVEVGIITILPLLQERVINERFKLPKASKLTCSSINIQTLVIGPKNEHLRIT